MALKTLFILLLLVQNVSAFVNYTSHDYNGTILNVTGEFEEFRSGNWFWGSWLFWAYLIPGALQYLPIAIVVILLTYIGYVKSGSIILPAIWLMFFSTVIGITLWAGLAPYLGYIIMAVLLTAIIVALMKLFYG